MAWSIACIGLQILSNGQQVWPQYGNGYVVQDVALAFFDMNSNIFQAEEIKTQYSIIPIAERSVAKF